MTACSSHTETPLIDAAGTGVDARPIDARTGDTDGGAGAATCEAYGYSCGDITGDNGEILSCGTCNSGETCNDHHCDARKPQACAEAGATCGQIDDGMGGTLDCGVCRAPATCGGAGRANLCAVPEGTPPAAGEWTWLSPSPIPLNAVDSFAVAANDVWAVGADGDVRHFDGTTWEAVAGGTNLDLHAVWGASADDVWIAGEGGALLHWDGEVFVPVVAGQGQADLRALAGTSASDVWLVGDGISMHYNGSAWSPAAATTPSLDALYIAATDDVWAIGEDLIWRFDSDSGWSSLPQYAPIQRLRGIYGRSPDEIYVVGYFAKTLQCDDELVFAWDGTAFTSIDTAADGSIQGIYGSTGQVVAARSSVPFCHGAGLSVLSGPAGLLNPPASIATATQLSPTQQFLLSELGEAFTSGGGAWTKSGAGTYQDLSLLAVIGDEAWAASASSIFERQGDELTAHPQGLAAGSYFVALAGASPTDVWALDFNPTTLVSGPLHHWNGSAWAPVELPDPAAGYHALFAESEGVIEVAGAGIYRLEGGTFSELYPVSTLTFAAMTHDPAGTLWAAGTEQISSGEDAGSPSTTVTVLRHAGTDDSEMVIPELTSACAIAALADNDVWVAGAGGVSHYDGATWTTTALSGTGGACSIVARADDDVFVIGNDVGGSFYHFDGATWTAQNVLPLGRLHAIAAGTDGVYAVGSRGQLMLHP